MALPFRGAPLFQPVAPDPRVTLARPDLAELALEGVMKAGAYRAPVAMQGAHPLTPVRTGPDADAEQIDQLAFGEIFDVLDTDGGWAWGRSRRDGVVGFAALEHLSETVLEPTHRVAVLTAPVEGRDDAVLNLNALVTVEETRGALVRAARLGWLRLQDLADFHSFDADPAAVAERFEGAPHERGGRAAEGLDAAGLVQQALYACGLGCPREADRQQALGRPASLDDLRRGDLLFWDGHAAVMLDAVRLIHAEPEGGVRIEALADAVARRTAPRACRRL